MRTTFPITPAFIKTAALREGANRDEAFYDSAVNGFYLRVYANGKKTFGVKWFVRGKQRRQSLGQASPAALDKARAKAVQIINAAKQDHVDLPAVERRKANRRTIAHLAPGFIADLRGGRYQAKNKQPRERTIAEIERYLVGSEKTPAAWKPLHRRYAEDVRRDDVTSVLDDIAEERGPVASDRALSALSTFYGWLLYKGHVETTPLQKTKKRANNGGRERVLSGAELKTVWRTCEKMDAEARASEDGRNGGANYTSIIRLLILTGQRKSEIGGLHRDEVNLEDRRIELPGHRTKNGRPHVVPLSRQAWAIVEAALEKTTEERPYLFGRWGNEPFGGWSDSKEELDERLGKMKHWVVHDLRRSVVTGLMEHRIADRDLIELIVNHVSGSRAGVAGTYQKAERLQERGEALQKWADLIAAVGGEQKRTA